MPEIKPSIEAYEKLCGKFELYRLLEEGSFAMLIE